MNKIGFALLIFADPLSAQTASTPQVDPWKAISFLEGTWDAKTDGKGGVVVRGVYTFQHELNGHILARHSSSDPNCKAPASFDRAHGDLLYVFQDAPGQPLKAIYFDSEGHVIHYDVSTPSASSVVFLSEASPGPQFRLVYEMKGSVMQGKFQMHPPGTGEWRSYLEWSGGRR